MPVAEIAHPQLHSFAWIEQVCVAVLERALLGIPVVDRDFEAIDLVDTVVVGHGGDVVDDLSGQWPIANLDLECRHVEVLVLVDRLRRSSHATTGLPNASRGGTNK